MAVGSTQTANNPTTGSGTWTIQPSSGTEWVLHNIVVSGAASLKTYDGTNTVVLTTTTGAQWFSNLQLHINNSVYLIITDTSGNTNLMHYDGIQTQ